MPSWPVQNSPSAVSIWLWTRNCSNFYFRAYMTWHNAMVFAESIFLNFGWHTMNEGVKFICKSFSMKPLKTFAGLNEGLKSLVEQNWRNFFLQVISMISMMISHACYCAKLKFKIYAFITKLINASFFNIFSIDHFKSYRLIASDRLTSWNS